MSKVWIEIDEDYAVTADSYQWILRRRSYDKETGEASGWNGRQSFYHNFDVLAKELGHEMLSSSGAQSMHDLVVAAAEIRLLLSEALTSSMEDRNGQKAYRSRST